MMKTVRSEQFYEEQLRQRITEKEKEMTSTLSEEERQVLGEEISQLNKAFKSIQPIALDDKEYRLH